jgi:glycosyltransferase involved in cell wall biosynthesis
MRRLLLITKTELGGAQRFVFDLATYLHQHGHDITVGYGTTGELVNRLQVQGIKTHRFDQLARSHNPLSTIFFIREIRAYLHLHYFDVVHCNSSNTLPAIFGIKKVPQPPIAIATIHGLSFAAPEHRSIVKPIYVVLYRFLLARFDHVAYLSTHDHDSALQKKFSDGPIIPLGIPNEQHLARERARQELYNLNQRLRTKGFLAAIIGRLAYPKNVVFAVNHFWCIKQTFPDAQLIIIGDGPDRLAIKKLITEKKYTNDIIMLGAIPSANRLLKAFDALIIPSTYEGTPYIALEALQAGIPVLASHVGGLHEVLPSTHLFKLNAESFSAVLSRLHSHSEIAVHIPPQRTIEHMAATYLSLYSTRVKKNSTT